MHQVDGDGLVINQPMDFLKISAKVMKSLKKLPERLVVYGDGLVNHAKMIHVDKFVKV